MRKASASKLPRFSKYIDKIGGNKKIYKGETVKIWDPPLITALVRSTGKIQNDKYYENHILASRLPKYNKMAKPISSYGKKVNTINLFLIIFLEI
jgi:hypothetical protein